MSFLRWTTRCEWQNTDTLQTLSIEKYDDRIRKGAALVVREGGAVNVVNVVAYFRNEDDARRVAEVFFGGVREPNQAVCPERP